MVEFSLHYKEHLVKNMFLKLERLTVSIHIM